jgi:predicted ATPase/serine/threonine protein kinase
MTPERYQRLQALLESALAREPAQRSSFLDEACAGDQSLRRDIDSLIASSEEAGAFLETPVGEMAAKLVNRDSIIKPGQVLGPYRVLSQIGSGGMGDVYLAEDLRLKRKVALKLLHPYVTKSGELFRRFEQEASAVSALNHPNILTIHEISGVAPFHFIVTEFIDGETLRNIMTRGPMGLPEVLRIASQVASALNAAHGSGVVHRDIKPENIMVRRDGYVKVLDFGIAKLNEASPGLDANLDALTRMKTTPGVLLGTVSYMSPEQARADNVDARTDLWSLGVILFEMITGHVPFKGATPTHVMVAIQDHEPAVLGLPADDASIEFERIVRKALAKNKTARYQTASEFENDLKKLQADVEFKSRLEQSAPALTGRPAATEPLSSSGLEVPNNLPGQLTPLIGRQAEGRAVRDQLLRDDVRVLTLTGPGGTGKTRLSLKTAGDLLGEFPDGVFFVGLAAINDSALVASTIAKALGIKEAAGSVLIEQLKEFLSERRMLLVIDNFEQVIAGAPVIVDLLNASRRMKVLVTSREPLRITGEHEFAVQPLAVPDSDQSLNPEAVTHYPAVELFLARATAVKPDFCLTPENARAIVQICSRLDGLPLAIELAAARVKVLPPQAMLARLESRLKVLMAGPRDFPPRQQTMRGAIAWSYDLLSEEERKLFRRLAVFVRGCDLEAIEGVCNQTGDLQIEVLDGVASLVDKSLLQQKAVADAEPRFTLLETITEFGLEQLDAANEAVELRRRHASYFLAFAEREGGELLGAQAERVLDKFETEHDNLRAALRWCAENEEAELGLKLATSVWRFWELRGYWTEGRKRLTHLLSLAQTPATVMVRLKALYAAGILADAQCDYAAARSLFEEKLGLHKTLGDQWGVANSINNLGIIALRERNFAAARALYEESLKLWRELGNEHAFALALGNLGNVAGLVGDFTSAQQHYEDSLAIFKKLTDQRGVAFSLGHLGNVARHRGDAELARSLYHQGLAILLELGDKRGAANLFAEMAKMADETGDYDQARRFNEESMVIFCELGEIRGIAQLLESYAQMANQRGRFERALRLAGAAAALREEFNARSSPDDEARLEQTLNSIRENLGETASKTAWNEGRSLPTEKAIQYALTADTL